MASSLRAPGPVRAPEPAETPAPEPGLRPHVPAFLDVDRYLARRSGGWSHPWRHWSERRALVRALARTAPIESVLDCPCGPGRVFWFWAERGVRVIGLDRSPTFTPVAQERLDALGLQGRIIQGEVADLGTLLPHRVDLVACIRFAYYFEPEDRPGLLRVLAAASRRYVLVQYKTTETWKGRRNQRIGRNQGKHFASLARIQDEVADAGLRMLAFVPHGPTSDRALVLAERPSLEPVSVMRAVPVPQPAFGA